MPVIVGPTTPDYAGVAPEKEVRGAFTKFAILKGNAISRDQRGVVTSLGDGFFSGAARWTSNRRIDILFVAKKD